MKETILIDGRSLDAAKFHNIVRGHSQVALAPEAKKRMQSSRDFVERGASSPERIYGVNTGFGSLSRVKVEAGRLDELQVNIIRSHSCNVGKPHSEVESRAMLLLRVNTLASGFSGVRPEVAEFLLQMLNRRVHPVIPEKGSVGASGDLSPLAHLALVVLGEGEAYFDGKRVSGSEALKKADLVPLKLKAKEGLSLINGTQQMLASGMLLVEEGEALLAIADLAAVCTLEGVMGSPKAFTDWVHLSRPHPGQIQSAKSMRQHMAQSQIAESHANCDRVQDAYSLRCAPQVHGAVRDLFTYAKNVFSVELNAAVDNPLVNPETGEIVSQGNFHGQPLAFALDMIAIGLSELASISERRLTKLLDPDWSALPSFLVKQEGVNSGFMAAQYTAASLVSENKIFCHPASVDSIPTCNEKEDHVSMGPNAARKARAVLENAQVVLAIELMAACQAIEFRKPLEPGVGPRAVLKKVRQVVPTLERDRALYKDIENITQLIRTGELLR